ncbi:hypothetical protein GS870_26440 [Rhodococcus hoagii]|nr:hypothetical protein [Prescottella equi]
MTPVPTGPATTVATAVTPRAAATTLCPGAGAADPPARFAVASARYQRQQRERDQQQQPERYARAVPAVRR